MIELRALNAAVKLAVGLAQRLAAATARPGFPDLVMRALRHFNLPAELLTLETVEHARAAH
ncbi:MAG TPA: hypothetical protein VNU71_13965 [Burkholderiaceae bacterium]|nr:hypothetical protein [Burkholderiaceae bacterium]